jgi:hypothetical protein
MRRSVFIESRVERERRKVHHIVKTQSIWIAPVTSWDRAVNQFDVCEGHVFVLQRTYQAEGPIACVGEVVLDWRPDVNFDVVAIAKPSPCGAYLP